MGSLAMWSGLAGAGKGLAEYSMKRIEDESYAKRSKIDEAREQRLADYQSKIRKEESTLEFGQDMSRTIYEQNRADTRAAEQDTKAMERVELQSQTQKDVEDIRQTGQTTRQSAEHEMRRTGEYFDPYKTAGVTNVWEARKMLNDRFESEVLSPEKATDIIGITTKEQVTTTYDKWSGEWFVQVGDKTTLGIPLTQEELKQRYPEGLPKPSPKKVELLLANPDKYQEWVQKYYYLPTNFLQARKAKAHRDLTDDFSRSRTSSTEPVTVRPTGEN